MQQIKHIVDQATGVFATKRILQRAKIADARFVEHGHLAVKQRPLARQADGGFAEGRKFLAPVEAMAGEKLGLAVSDAAERAVAVELHFVKPFVAVRYLIDERS